MTRRFSKAKCRSLNGCLATLGLLAAACGGASNSDKSNGSGGCGESGCGESGAAGSSGSSGSSALAGRAGSGGASGSGASSGLAGSSSPGGAGSLAGSGGQALEPRPSWDPPFARGDTSFGEEGWRESSVPICTEHSRAVTASSVWADERGVYALLTAVPCDPFTGSCGAAAGTEVQFNDGTGWQLVFEETSTEDFGGGLKGFVEISGLPLGPIALMGGDGIYFLEDGTPTFQTEGAGLFGVSSTSAFAQNGAELLEYSNEEWSSSTSGFGTLRSLWANEERVLVPGENTIYEREVGAAEFSELPGVPAGLYSSVWAFGAEDVWAGNQAGQLVHYDGTDWTVFPTGAEHGGIEQLWGDDGTVYFRTEGEFGRADVNGAEILLAPVPGSVYPHRLAIDGMWGSSEAEVFLALSDGDFYEYECGSRFLVWFDGRQFHSF